MSISKNLKIFIVLDILVVTIAVYYFTNKNDREPASIPEHKRAQFQNKLENYEKPRASIRLRGEPIERTEHNTFILRASVKLGVDEITELRYVWHLPDSARVFRGDANGILLIDEINQIEIEIGLDNPDSITDIGLEAYYIQNGVKLGSVKNFQLNKPEAGDKFERAKAAFEQDLEKSNQKIVQ